MFRTMCPCTQQRTDSVSENAQNCGVEDDSSGTAYLLLPTSLATGARQRFHDVTPAKATVVMAAPDVIKLTPTIRLSVQVAVPGQPAIMIPARIRWADDRRCRLPTSIPTGLETRHDS